MIGEEHVIQEGKFAGCWPSDIPKEELRHWATRGASTALDRLALQDHYRATRRRRHANASWPASAVSPNRGESNATTGASARTVGHSFGVGEGLTAGAR